MARRRKPRPKRPGEISDEEIIAAFIAANGVTECDDMTCDNPVPNRFEGISVKRSTTQSILCSRLFRHEPPERKPIYLDIMIMKKKRNLANELISV